MEKVDFLSVSKGVGNVFDPFQWQHKETAKAVISKANKKWREVLSFHTLLFVHFQKQQEFAAACRPFANYSNTKH